MADARGGSGFRDDINGMRAIAVLGVVAYHFQLARLQGGFVGVDVFFVISGFLMTRIIAGRLAQDRFTFAEFYGARVRRILPALVVLVVAVTSAGYVLLDPLRLEALAQDAMASLLFLSNVLYLGQGGYFAAAAEENWLLHTWSLSVEWQFYILYPLLLWSLHRTGRGTPATIAALALIAVLSFARTVASAHAGGYTLTLSFYMIPTRAWEFLVGALAAYALSRVQWPDRARAVVHAIGIAVVLTSMVLLQSRTAVWPSAWTALPVAGTALVLVADRQTARWAELPPVAALGRWSYSIYLWHWPLAALAASFGFRSLGMRAGLAMSSVALGALSYRFVECWATDALWRPPGGRWRLGLPAYGLAITLAGIAIGTHGLESVRFAFRPNVLAALRDYRAAKIDWMSTGDCDGYLRVSNYFSECWFGNPAAHDTLVIGDSFAEQLIPRYRGAFRNADFGLTFLARGGCIPMPGIERIPFGSNCAAWASDAYAFARDQDFKRVVFIAFWTAYDRDRVCLAALADCGASLEDKAFDAAVDASYLRAAEMWRALIVQHKAVIVIEEPPFGAGDPNELYRQALKGEPVTTSTVPLAVLERNRAPAMARLARAVASAGATLVNPAPALCPNGLCPFVANGRDLYMDGYHLRASLMKDSRFAIYDRYILPADAAHPPIN